MFKQIIRRPSPLANEIADEYFSNIMVDEFSEDCSMTNTLRALVAPRMAKDDVLFVSIASKVIPSSLLIEYTNDHVGFTYRIHDPRRNDMRNRVKIVNCRLETADAAETCFNYISDAFGSDAFAGWHPLEEITRFYRKSFSVMCYINPEIKGVILFVDNLTLTRYHYLQASCLAFLPWYFNKEQGLSEREMRLINALRDKTSTAYTTCLCEIAEQYDFRALRINRLLDGFETRFEKQEAESLRLEIQDVDRKIDHYYDEIAATLRRRQDYDIRLLGLEAKIAQGGGESEIKDYFLSNKNVRLDSVTDNYMIFVTTGYLEFYDEDMAKSAIQNKGSYVYMPRGKKCNNIIPEDDIALFMSAVFLTHKLRIRMCAAYNFELGAQVASLRAYQYGVDLSDCTPNPHIDAYSCMGNYRQAITELVRHNDYIMAIEQCIASCKSLNFGDGTVMTEFMCRIYGLSNRSAEINMRCVELPDGSVVTPKEAIAYLKAEENEHE